MIPSGSSLPPVEPPFEGALFTQSGLFKSSPRLVIVTIGAAIALLYFGRTFFITITFALFLSFAMRPFVSLLERARVPRVVAILLLLFVLIGAIVLLVINVTAQVNQFYTDLPLYQNRIRDALSQFTDFVNRLRERMGTILPDETRGSVREVKITESPLATTRAFVAQVGETLHFLLYAAAVPFLTFFMARSRARSRRRPPREMRPSQ